MVDRARLEIGSQGERYASDVLSFLSVVSNTHDALAAFMNAVDGDRFDDLLAVTRTSPRPRFDDFDRNTYVKVIGAAANPVRPVPARVLNAFVPQDDRLQVLSIAVASPGIWEFLGSLVPLAAIDQFLRGLHERRKDRDYRNALEEQQLQLVNRRAELENRRAEVELHARTIEVVADGIRRLEESGLSGEEIDYLKIRLIIDPLVRMESVSEAGMAFPKEALADIRHHESRAKGNSSTASLPPLLE